MSQVPGVTVSASHSEQNATSLASARPSSSTSTPPSKLRSCIVCRSRKVRCDKKSPCSNCRQANIACVLPAIDRPPRWARKLDRLTNNAAAIRVPPGQNAKEGIDKVMDRLQSLEKLVKELNAQLEEAQTAVRSASVGSSAFNTPVPSIQHRDAEHHITTASTPETSNVHHQFGRLVLQDTNRSRFVSSGFWSRVNDELEGLKTDSQGLVSDDSGSSEDEMAPEESRPTQELERTPWERHAFLFRHNLTPGALDLREFHPLPSQVPFLLDIFSEKVNFLMQIVHMPSITAMVRELRGSDMSHLAPSNEALLFSVYYAAITSMEEDDVTTNFGYAKTDLNLKYRLGLEHALAKADFLYAPDIALVQTLAIFLCLARRHDSPRFVWMLTGVAIRMAQYLGLQRDGSHFENLTPFEVEARRRVWWALYALDLRTSEDQGTDMMITPGSFDTRIPLNINDEDINRETKQTPIERGGVTDMTLARTFFGVSDIMRQLTASGGKGDEESLADQSRLLDKIYQKFEGEYLQLTTDSESIFYWVGVNIARLSMAKMTLIVFLPVLFSSPSEHLTAEIRTKLLVSAIEVAEYNHVLNAEKASRQWRWIYQTYTHWHAIVYLMIEISRRPWSPIVERAWVALHSRWLIPPQTVGDKSLRIWIPLRKLMAQARKHRNGELNRLRANPHTAASLDAEDQQIPLPSSSGSFPFGANANSFRERWYQVIARQEKPRDETQISGASAEAIDPAMHTTYLNEPDAEFPVYNPEYSDLNAAFQTSDLATSGEQVGRTFRGPESGTVDTAFQASFPGEFSLGQTVEQPYIPSPAATVDWSDGRTMGPGFVSWLWADADPSADVFASLEMDLSDAHADVDAHVNWYDWVQSAQGLEMGANHGSNNAEFSSL